LDPLDVELLERAVDAVMVAIKANSQGSDFDSDEELEAALRSELIEIARLNGLTEPEVLRDILLDNSSSFASR
jgi:hypothetical protein